jgi:hypothetical protein
MLGPCWGHPCILVWRVPRCLFPYPLTTNLSIASVVAPQGGVGCRRIRHSNIFLPECRNWPGIPAVLSAVFLASWCAPAASSSAWTALCWRPVPVVVWWLLCGFFPGRATLAFIRPWHVCVCCGAPPLQEGVHFLTCPPDADSLQAFVRHWLGDGSSMPSQDTRSQLVSIGNAAAAVGQFFRPASVVAALLRAMEQATTGPWDPPVFPNVAPRATAEGRCPLDSLRLFATLLAPVRALARGLVKWTSAQRRLNQSRSM